MLENIQNFFSSKKYEVLTIENFCEKYIFAGLSKVLFLFVFLKFIYYFQDTPYLEFNVNSDIVFPNSGIPIFLSKYIKSTVENTCLPKKFLIYSPNLFVNSYEKKPYENLNSLEIVSFANSEKSDQTQEEIFQEMKECYSRLSIKTRFFVLIDGKYFYM